MHLFSSITGRIHKLSSLSLTVCVSLASLHVCVSLASLQLSRFAARTRLFIGVLVLYCELAVGAAPGTRRQVRLRGDVSLFRVLRRIYVTTSGEG